MKINDSFILLEALNLQSVKTSWLLHRWFKNGDRA